MKNEKKALPYEIITSAISGDAQSVNYVLEYYAPYIEELCKRRVIYAVDLLELREKEKKVIRDQLDGLDTYVSGKATLNEVFDRYMATKYDLKPQTRVSYKYMYDHFVSVDLI